MDTGNDVRHRTLWFGKEESSNSITVTSGPVSYVPPSQLDASSTIQGKHPGPSQRNNHSHLSTFCQAIDQDPWTVYKAKADMCYCRNVTLAQHRKHKLEIVHIQHLPMVLSSAQALVRTIDQFSHQSFPRLLGFYHHPGSCFLVWEPVELSINEVLASRWRIEKVDLAQIVWSVSGVLVQRYKWNMTWRRLVTTSNRSSMESNFFVIAEERRPRWFQKRSPWLRMAE